MQPGQRPFAVAIAIQGDVLHGGLARAVPQRHHPVQQVADHQQLPGTLLEAAHVEQSGGDHLPGGDGGDPGQRQEHAALAGHLHHEADRPGRAALLGQHHHVAHLGHHVPDRVEDGGAGQAGGVAALLRGRAHGWGPTTCSCAASCAIHVSTSSGRRGAAAERFSTPSAVTSTSSSIRTPIPRSSAGTSRSFSLKYRPGSMVKIIPGSSSASRYISRRAWAQSWTSRPRWWLVPCGIHRRCCWPSALNAWAGGTGNSPHSPKRAASTSIAAPGTPRNFTPGRAKAKAASAASRTASYTRRWTSVKVPETGKVRVMSAV